jgi:hypothetical protein
MAFLIHIGIDDRLMLGRSDCDLLVSVVCDGDRRGSDSSLWDSYLLLAGSPIEVVLAVALLCDMEEECCIGLH